MTSIWGGTSQRTVHCDGAAVEAITASFTLDWTTVNGGTNSLSRFIELDARNGSVSVKIPAAPGIAHNGRKIKISVNNDDTSTVNFRGVVFTGGSPIERGTLPVQTTYAMDRKSGHIVIQVVNGVAKIRSGASFNQDPELPSNASLLATLQSWTTGATWIDLGNGEAYAQFNVNGSFAPQRALNAWVLALGGGGAAAGGVGGGGGAGRFVENTALSIAVATYAATIGAGGIGNLGDGTSGGQTSLGSILIAAGGGRGGTNGSAGAAGGSGGGGGANNMAAGAAAAGSSAGGLSPNQTGFGFAGGAGANNGSTFEGGGGGGAGTVGGAGQPNNGALGGVGGNGRASSITGTSVIYGGGGGGGTTAGQAGTGGTGGGGTNGSAGSANRGSGGGSSANGVNGGNGGSGVIVLRVSLLSAIGF